MKKKVFINGRFLTQSITGVQRTAFELVQALDELITNNREIAHDYDFVLIYPGKEKVNISLSTIRILNKGMLKGNLWEQFELPFYTGSSLLISMCTVSSLFKRKQFVFIHDVSFIVNPDFFPFAVRKWYKFAIPLLGKLSRLIITVSQFSKTEIANHTGTSSKKIEVISNAADHLIKYNEPSKDFQTKINSLKPYVLAVSSMGKNKNFQGIANAISKIDFANYSMVIAGGTSGTLSSALPSETVTYLGYVSNEELRYLYSHASLFVFPSFYEGFGIPPLEAMISGCPVLASNTSSIPEVLGDACEYCDPYNVDDIAAKIRYLISNPQKLEELKLKGLEKALEYSWSNSAATLLSLIKKQG